MPMPTPMSSLLAVEGSWAYSRVSRREIRPAFYRSMTGIKGVNRVRTQHVLCLKIPLAEDRTWLVQRYSKIGDNLLVVNGNCFNVEYRVWRFRLNVGRKPTVPL